MGRDHRSFDPLNGMRLGVLRMCFHALQAQEQGRPGACAGKQREVSVVDCTLRLLHHIAKLPPAEGRNKHS